MPRLISSFTFRNCASWVSQENALSKFSFSSSWKKSCSSKDISPASDCISSRILSSSRSFSYARSSSCFFFPSISVYCSCFASSCRCFSSSRLSLVLILAARSSSRLFKLTASLLLKDSRSFSMASLRASSSDISCSSARSRFRLRSVSSACAFASRSASESLFWFSQHRSAFSKSVRRL